MDLKGAHITWYGHGTFVLRTPGGKTIMVDPWVQGNPACPAELKTVGKLDDILITHGHFDHISDAITVASSSQPQHVVAIAETANWLDSKGVANVVGMNKGGTFDLGGVKVTMTHADHSCGITDGDRTVYGGEAVGFVITCENGLKIYAAGDTNVFSDMAIIGDLYEPDVAILPIGDFYTMGPREAAYAVKLLRVPAVIPVHYATFPALTGTPSAFRDALGMMGQGSVEVIDMSPGQTIG
ncbi:MAG TPA: metal-dependent hydrolase [Ktedonobacterales bacterium]|nr:metal-dependent hydrolase [Ktedonobacterales bacterium]